MRYVFLVIWVVLSVGVARGDDYCSLVVKVVSADGVKLSGIPVTVREKDGRSESKLSEMGEVQFCALGVRHVSVTVGRPGGCSFTTIDGVPLAWGRTREVMVVFDDLLCRLDGPPPLLPCAVLLRFVDERGNWIPSVEFSPPLARAPMLSSDRYGRAMVRMGKDEQVHTKARKSGFHEEPLDFECSSNLLESERVVTMRSIRRVK